MMRGGWGPGGMAAMGRGGVPSYLSAPRVALKSSPWKLMRRLGGIVAAYRRALILAALAVVAASALQMLMPWAFKRVIDVTIPRRDARELLLLGLALGAMQAARYGLGFAQRYWLALLSQQLVYRMAKDLFEHIQRLSLRFYERWDAGEIISRITNDIQAMQQAVQGGTVMAAVGLVNMLAFAIIMALLDWPLALLVYATVPLLVVASAKTADVLRGRYLRVQQSIAEVNSVLQEDISGVRVAQAFAHEAEQRRRFDAENRGNLDANMATAGVQAVATPAIQTISALGMALVLGIGGWQVLQHALTVGTLVAFVSYLIQFYQPVEDLIRVNNTLQQALAASERIFDYLDEVPDVVDRPGAAVLRGCSGRVAFERVTFSYQPGKPVLHDISLVAEPGQTIALVGRTGSGKTTAVNLIPRFYDPDIGRLTLDGRDLREVSLRSLRDQVGVVLQETFLFGASIKDNIRYGRLEATDEEVVEAARQAHAHPFIQQLTGAYDAWAGEGGVLLSRGQRQRIGLARAILKDPRILILDEATSDVDTETEVLIQRALEQVMHGRTTFVIAHRLSTIRNADQIVLLEQGRVAERGTHAELLAAGSGDSRSGRYADLYAAQFAGQATVHDAARVGAAAP